MATIAAKLETSATGRKVTLTAGDAGLLARGLFAFESMRGGQLTAAAGMVASVEVSIDVQVEASAEVSGSAGGGAGG